MPTRQATKIGALLLSLALAQGAFADSETPVVATESWLLRLPEERTVVFHGTSNADDAGLNAGGMLYPAPTPLGFLAAVVTHALIIDGSKRSQLSKRQEEADKVLTLYRPVIDKMNGRELMTSALAISKLRGTGKTTDAGTVPTSETLVESAPVFWITPDQESIIVDNALSILKPGVAPDSAYRNEVRVVYTPHGSPSPQTYWLANNGEKLREAAIKLLAESIDIALQDASLAATDEKPFRTLRFTEGKQEKMERAQLLEDRCGRMLLKTLRGSLMSVPRLQASPSTETACLSGITQSK